MSKLLLISVAVVLMCCVQLNSAADFKCWSGTNTLAVVSTCKSAQVCGRKKTVFGSTTTYTYFCSDKSLCVTDPADCEVCKTNTDYCNRFDKSGTTKCAIETVSVKLGECMSDQKCYTAEILGFKTRSCGKCVTGWSGCSECSVDLCNAAQPSGIRGAANAGFLLIGCLVIGVMQRTLF